MRSCHSVSRRKWLGDYLTFSLSVLIYCQMVQQEVNGPNHDTRYMSASQAAVVLYTLALSNVPFTSAANIRRLN